MKTEDVAIFNHAKNITIGRGRVIWASNTVTTAGQACWSGWVLPGGMRTLDESRARTVALLIDGIANANAAGLAAATTCLERARP